jgi:SpoIID/LytB domain protein
LTLALAGVLVAPVPARVAAAAVGAPAAPASSPDVVIDGKGWGHGVGMSQDGALAMGLAGAGTEDILDAFYPGTSIGHRSGDVDVTLFEGAHPQSVTVALPGGGEIRDASGDQPAGFPISVSSGGSVRISAGGAGMVAAPLNGASAADNSVDVQASGPPASGTSAAAASAPATPESPPTSLLLGLIPVPVPTTAPAAAAPPAVPGATSAGADARTGAGEPTSGHSLRIVPEGSSAVELPDQGRRYGGSMEAVPDGGGGLQFINHIDVEHYLRGMGEVRDPGWPAAALRAQAIAARTYALRAPSSGNTLCSNDQCQVYLGETVEYSAMDAAVADTEGEVLLYKGSLALAVYSASGGGVSATPEEGFGSPDADTPYLRSAPYPTQDPVPWTVRMPLSELATRFGYRGDVTGVRVSKAGPSGRAMEVTFDGPSGPAAVDGRQFAKTLGLKSNFFTLRLEAPAPGEPNASGANASAAVLARFGHSAPSGLLANANRDLLGRAPWIALALLLIVGWALLAARARAHRADDRRS